jgi:hypothetical protein
VCQARCVRRSRTHVVVALTQAAQRSRRDEEFAAAMALYGGDYLPDDISEEWTIELREIE